MTKEAIFRAKTLAFQGAGLYKQEVVLPIDGQGRVLVHGPEGAGKSMIAEVLTINILGKGSLRLRKERLTDSTICNLSEGYPGFYSRLNCISGTGSTARDVEILRAYKHNEHKSKIKILIDNKMQKADGKPARKKLIHKLVPLSDGEWHSVVYLHQGGTLDLLAGSPSDKRSYVTSIFGLDFYEDLVEAAKEKLSSLRSSAASIKLDNFGQQVADLKEDIRKVQREIEAVGDVSKLKDKSDKCHAKYDKLSKEVGRCSAMQSQIEAADELEIEIFERESALSIISEKKVEKASNENKKSITAHMSSVADIKSQLKSLSNLERIYDRANEREKSTLRTLRVSEERLEKSKAKAGAAPSEDTLKATIAKLHACIDVEEDLATSVSMKRPKDGLKLPKLSVAKYIKKVLGHQHTISALETMLEAVGDKNCPTCDQPVDAEAIRSSIEDLNANIAKAEKMAKRRARMDLFADITDQFWGDEDDASDVDEAHKDLISLIQKIPALEATVVEAEKAHVEAKEELSEATAPTSTDELDSKLVTQKKALVDLEEKQEEIQDLLALYPQMEVYKGMSFDMEAGDKIPDLVTKRDKAEKKYKKVVEDLANAKALISSKATTEKKLKRADEQLQELADEVALTKRYEDEILPYFVALRTGKVQNCFSVLEGVLPVYLASMGSAQYRGAEAKFVIKDDLSKVDLFLTAGKDAPTLSAKQSSSGQRQRFTLAIAAAVREISPRHANFMFFDEPFTALESDGKARFINQLLPMLMERCEDLTSVFIVAHDEEVLNSGKDMFDAVWSVDYGKDGSTITRSNHLGRVVGK